jgi:hypothetical protein
MLDPWPNLIKNTIAYSFPVETLLDSDFRNGNTPQITIIPLISKNPDLLFFLLVLSVQYCICDAELTLEVEIPLLLRTVS